MFGAALGGETEQGDGRLGADQNARARGRGDGDVGELRGSRIDDHGAIGEGHQAAVSHGRVLKRHDKNAGNQLSARVRPDRVKGGAHGFGGAVHGASHRAIGIARCHHEGGEVERSAGDGFGFDLGNALGAAALVVQGRVFATQRG